MTMPGIPAEAVEAAVEWLRKCGLPFDDFGHQLLARRALAAALPHLHERWLAEAEGALREDRLAEVVALATAEHHLANLTAMGDDGCVCGQWGDGKDGPGWDDHMADVSLATAADYLRDVLGAGAGGEGE